MSRMSALADVWFGLCRKPPVVRALQADIVTAQEFTREGLPDGGGSRSGIIRRGIGAALFGMRTLNRNRQLLWFTLIAGLILAGNCIGHAAFRCINWSLQPGTIVVYIQDFSLGFVTVFGLVFLLAGLVLSVTSKKEGPASCLEGLYGAKRNLKAILLWSLVLVLAGILLDRIYVYFTIIRFPYEFRFLFTIMDGFFLSTITQFPFNWTLDWNMLTELPGYGGRSLLLWLYPFGFLETLQFSVLTLILFILTPYVVPLIVLRHMSIREAVVESSAMLKKSWAGVATCALFLGVIIIGVFLLHLILQAASGIVNPYRTVIFHPPGSWIALALGYNLALLILVFVIATVAGIAVLNLYRSAQTGQIPGFSDP